MRHVARLARLALDDDEVDRYAAQLSAILEHVDAVRRLDTADVPPTAHPLPGRQRACAPTPRSRASTATTVLAQAPAVEDDRFRVPRIIGEAP